MRHTLIMIKPDAMECPGILAVIDDEIKSSGLSVSYRCQRRLTVEDVDELFPEIVHVCYPLRWALVRRYLTAGLVEFLLLSGDDAIVLGRQLRHRIRERHAASRLINAVHASVDPGEATAQLRWLARFDTEVAKYVDPDLSVWFHPADPGGRGVFGALAARDIGAIVDDAWPVIWRRRGIRLWKEPTGGQWTVTVFPDGVNTFDSAASALYEHHPTLTPVDAVLIPLETDRAGQLDIYRGNQVDAQRLAAALSNEHMAVTCGRSLVLPRVEL